MAASGPARENEGIAGTTTQKTPKDLQVSKGWDGMDGDGRKVGGEYGRGQKCGVQAARDVGCGNPTAVAAQQNFDVGNCGRYAGCAFPAVTYKRLGMCMLYCIPRLLAEGPCPRTCPG